MNKYKFIRNHGDKAVMDKVLMEFYITVYKILSDKLNH